MPVPLKVFTTAPEVALRNGYRIGATAVYKFVVGRPVLLASAVSTLLLEPATCQRAARDFPAMALCATLHSTKMNRVFEARL